MVADSAADQKKAVNAPEDGISPVKVTPIRDWQRRLQKIAA